MNPTKPTPPRWATKLLRWYCAPHLVEEVQGDLEEEFDRHLKRFGERRARKEYIRDVIGFIKPFAIRRKSKLSLNNTAMIKSYFTIGWRSIVRQRLYSVINILGLALGICACIVIYTISSYELNFDTFHPDKERIYRVVGNVMETSGNKLQFNRLPIPLLQNAKTQLTGIESIAGLIPYNAAIKIEETSPVGQFNSHTTGTHDVTTVIAEPQYFKIFSYQWLEGNATNALSSSLSVVLTEKRATEYFGSMPLQKIIGKQVNYEDSLVATVTGIVKDWEGNTDFAYTDFISFASLQTGFLKRRIDTESWKLGDMTCRIFTKLSNKVEPNAVNSGFEKISKSHVGEIKLTPWLEPISNIHFNANIIENPIRTAHLPTLYSLMAIAAFLLFLAVINFVNLSTAQTIQRAKEVGVRKVMGGSRWSLSFQFVTETFMLTAIAAVLAVPCVEPILIEFKTFVPSGVTFHLFQSSTIIFCVIVVLSTTLLSGFYPASVLSSYIPALNLRGVGSKSVNEKWILRQGLIVFQFSVSLVFIIGSIVISKQLNYTREKELGFTADAIITVDTPWGDRMDKIARLNERVKLISGVKNVALQWVSPMMSNGRSRPIKFKSTDEKAVKVVQLAGNEEFIPVYQIKLLAGRNLAHADSIKEFVINESLSKLMGCKNPEDALGKILYWDNKPKPVVGVVADFHTRSFYEAIAPLCIVNRPDREATLAIKLSSKGKKSDLIKSTLIEIEKRWKGIYQEVPFTYSFYDESLAQMYENDQRTAMLINTSMVIAILISCIGLFGLTLFTAERRSKEISIRKIMGASISNIAVMLSKDFVLLMIIALFVASPIALYFTDQWLQKFAYHITVTWWVFALAGFSSLFITLMTVSYQSIKAATADPVKNLRSE